MLMAPSSTVLIPKPQAVMCSNETVVRMNDAGWKKEVTRIYRKSFVHPPVKHSTPPANLNCQSSWFGRSCTKLPQKSTKSCEENRTGTVYVFTSRNLNYQYLSY